MKAVNKDLIIFDPDRHLCFDLDALETYGFARRETSVVDALTVMAAIDYADRIIRRPAYQWRREIHIRVPLYEPDRWYDDTVAQALDEALRLLTGDTWKLEFASRSGTPPPKPQALLELETTDTLKVMAYSDGLDSRAVMALEDASNPGAVLRVRVGNTHRRGERRQGRPTPFTGIPYCVKFDQRPVEPSARSRGFRFAMFAGIAAFLVNVKQAVVPESGQGIFGPALVTTLHGYADYRNHPFFTSKVSKLIKALFSHDLEFVFPRMWSTKGETLLALLQLGDNTPWQDTRSCWQDARWCSLNGKRLQCGVCAACLLRRQSFHQASITEPANTYVCENLGAPKFAQSFPHPFRQTKVLRHYALAAVKQLDRFNMDWLGEGTICTHAANVSLIHSTPLVDVHAQLRSLVHRHTLEWNQFIKAQGPNSFVRQWAGE